MGLSPTIRKKLIFSILINTVLFALLLFVFAGTWDWWRGWVLVGTIFIMMVLTVIGLRNHEELLLERLKPPLQPGQPFTDKVIILLFIISYLCYFIFIPLDRFHLHLFNKPNIWISSLGMVLIIAGSWVVYLALRENTFAVPVVKFQKERNQKVIDTGVYGIVRHPMYAGLVLFMIGMPLWLESYAGVLFALIPIGFLMFRVFFEERFLQKKLEGYKLYMNKVPYRVIPYIW